MPQVQETRSGALAEESEWSKAKRAAVVAELHRILADPAFSKSKRCGDLLRRLVEQALSGEIGGIKERTLGVEVFGREADYDNNADPIVRRTANEIRKRLAQYYQELDERQAVKIHLIPGSYIPEFDFSSSSVAVAPQQQVSLDPITPPATDHHTVHKLLHTPPRRAWLLATAVALLVVLAGALLVREGFFRSSQFLFWQPLLEAKDAPLLCVADDSLLEWKGTLQNSAQAETIASMIASRGDLGNPASSTSPRSIPYIDANVAHGLSGWLSENGRSTILEPASLLTLEDLRHRPAVLIGGFDNPWSLALLSGLRFSPQVDPAKGTLWVRDAKNPAKHDWVYSGTQTSDSTVDYAVISRFFDTETGNWIVALAGLGQHGTDAARQFLLDPTFTASLPHGMRSARNVQMVIKTTIIKGNTGPPQLIAFHTW